MPFVRPVTTTRLPVPGEVTVTGAPTAGAQVAVYVGATPQTSGGGVKLRVAERFPGVPVVMTGAAGGEPVVMLLE